MIGFAVKVLGEPGLRSHDTRRWQSGPHLAQSLRCLREVFAYLDRVDIRMYRMASGLAPYLSHPDLPQFHRQVEECAQELAQMGEYARTLGLRLSFHPSQYVLLNAESETIAAHAAVDISGQARILEAMGLGPEAVVVTHIGGLYGAREASRARFVASWEQLPEVGRRRLVLENDDTSFGVGDTLWVHQRTGIRLVFDYLHHMLANPEGMSVREAVAQCLGTWGQVRPKVHFSSTRTELRAPPPRRARTLGQLSPALSDHADFANPFELICFLREAGEVEFDLMLEVKAKDLAVLRLREFLRSPAGQLACRVVGLEAGVAAFKPVAGAG